MKEYTFSNVNNRVDRSAIIEKLEYILNTAKNAADTFMIYISNDNFECRNNVDANDFELDEKDFHLSYGSYELHINLNETDIKYLAAEENNYEGELFIFSLVKYNTEISMVF